MLSRLFKELVMEGKKPARTSKAVRTSAPEDDGEKE
jgi:hypothetical protein